MFMFTDVKWWWRRRRLTTRRKYKNRRNAQTKIFALPQWATSQDDKLRVKKANRKEVWNDPEWSQRRHFTNRMCDNSLTIYGIFKTKQFQFELIRFFRGLLTTTQTNTKFELAAIFLRMEIFSLKNETIEKLMTIDSNLNAMKIFPSWKFSTFA